MPEGFANRYQTTLAAGVTAGALTGTVATATGAPAVPFRAIISAEGANTDEIVLVTGRTGTTLTWTRAAEAIAGVQAASAHVSGATITAIVTAAGLLGGLLDTTVPTTQAFGDVAAAGSAAAAAHRDHLHGMPAEGVAISALSAVTFPAPTDEFVVNQGGTSKKVTLGQIAAGYAVVKDECFFVAATDLHAGGVVQHIGGTGAATTVGAVTVGHPGIISLNAGTQATGRCAMRGGEPGIAFGSYGVRYGATVNLPVLSTATVTYTARLGFGDGVSGADFVDALGFRYTDAVNTGKWEAYALSNSGDTAADTGITADTNWHLYEISVNAAGTSALFYIDKVLVATLASGIPSGAARATQLAPALIRKSVDATAADRSLLLDNYYYIFEMSDLRS